MNVKKGLALGQCQLEAEAEEGEATESDAADAATATPESLEFAPYTKRFYIDLSLQHEATAIDYEAKRDGYARSIEIYERVISDRDQELRDLLDLYREHDVLESDLTQATENYNFLWGKENEARLKQLQAEKLGYIQITEPARKPDTPVPSRMFEMLIVGGVVSVLAGFILSFFLEFLSSVRRAARRRRVE